MPRKTPDSDVAFYCDPCEAAFRIPRDAFTRGAEAVIVACPTCKRNARASRGADGRIQVAHNRHIFQCPRPLESNPLVVVFVYVGAIAVLALVFAAITRIVSPYLCPIVFFAALIAVGVIGAIQLASVGALNRSYVELMRIFYKGLPNLLGRQVPEGALVSEAGASSTGNPALRTSV